MKVLSWSLLVALALSVVGILPTRLHAGPTLGVEATARTFVVRALRAERAKDFAAARAWYRTASAAYRLVVLPLRLTQIDYFYETGLLVPADFVLGGTGSEESAVFAPEILDDSYVAARERLVDYCESRADVTLKQAQKLEIAHDVLTPGVVPLEPPAPRRALERLVAHVVDVGVYRLLLAHRYDDVDEEFKKVSARSAIKNIRSRWQKQRNFDALAAQAEYGARLTENVGIVYAKTLLESLKQSIEPDNAAPYRKDLSVLRRRLSRQRQEAGDAYAAAAAVLEANGEVGPAIVMRSRAQSFLTHARRSLGLVSRAPSGAGELRE